MDDSIVISFLDIVKAVEPLREKYKIDAVYIFGSYARNEATAESDVDFLVYGGNAFLALTVETEHFKIFHARLARGVQLRDFGKHVIRFGKTEIPVEVPAAGLEILQMQNMYQFFTGWSLGIIVFYNTILRHRLFAASEQ